MSLNLFFTKIVYLYLISNFEASVKFLEHRSNCSFKDSDSVKLSDFLTDCVIRSAMYIKPILLDQLIEALTGQVVDVFVIHVIDRFLLQDFGIKMILIFCIINFLLNRFIFLMFPLFFVLIFNPVVNFCSPFVRRIISIILW